MNLVKQTGAVLIAATIAACADAPKLEPQKQVAIAEPAAAPMEEQNPVTEQSEIAIAQLPPEEPKIVTDKSVIATAQRALNQLGYNAGKPDGIVGPNTRQAIRAFQKLRGLVQDGQLTATLADKLKSESSIAVRPGDLLLYSDGETEFVTAARHVSWIEGTPSPVAIRPSTDNWPPAARAGLDWAASHALDDPQKPVKWSSTGVSQRFEIYVFELSPGETALADSDGKPCRRYELRADQSLYPAIACRAKDGAWYIPHSSVRLARPATELGSAAPYNSSDPRMPR